MNAYDWLDNSLETIHKAGWYRQPQVVSDIQDCVIKIHDRPLINFGSNNYLGLAGDHRLQKSAIAAIEKYGTGTTSSRLIVGNYSIHQQLEQEIANWKNTESALVFSSGYTANIGIIPALVGSRDLILSDAYNHACLKNGAKLSGAKLLEYAHNNHSQLCDLLQANRANYRRTLIITDSIFSMDGDIAPLQKIVELGDRFAAMVLVDEAHAVGVFGHTGAGLVEAIEISTPIIQMGTLSKALGSMGGYVAGTKNLISYLQNRCGSWIYSTGLSPADSAAARTAIQIVRHQPQRRLQLWQNCHLLEKLLGIGIKAPIVPLKVGTTPKTLKVAEHLQQQGFFVPAIRPPTVPTPRLRLSLMADHSPAQIEAVAQALKPYL